jgi:hypothetical protein
MSTPNFALKNASRYFVFGMPVYYIQEDINENGLDQDLLDHFDKIGSEANYEADKENVAYELKEKGWHDIDEFDYDRNYPTHFFSEKTKTIKCGDNRMDITIQAGCTSGYYEASIFDWFVVVKTYKRVDYCYETCDYVYGDFNADDVIRDDWYDNAGLSKIHAAHIINKIESVVKELSSEAELAFSMNCDEEMYCAYQCSNGEAGYSRTDKRLWQEVEEQKKKKTA